MKLCRKHKELRIVAFVLTIVIVLGSALAFGVSKWVEYEDAMSKQRDDGFIRLPNNYNISKISAVDRVLCRQSTNPNTSMSENLIIVDFDIDAISFNDRYVFYHITNKQNLHREMPGSRRFGILDTQTGTVNDYETLDEAKTALKTLGADLELQSVKDFFPETKGVQHPFTLE